MHGSKLADHPDARALIDTPGLFSDLEQINHLTAALLNRLARSIVKKERFEQLYMIGENVATKPGDATILARIEYRRRRARSAAFNGFRFDHEPGWDILLDLMSTADPNRWISTTSACIASAVPATTALRHLQILEEAGLIDRKPHERDQRVSCVRISPAGRAAFESYFGS